MGLTRVVAGRDDLESFLGKWRARWPEWRVAEVFLPARAREASLAWACLRQELADAAWTGTDPLPGEAKLGWWIEELQGWPKGAHRHPLGQVLQPRAVPWAALANAVPTLLAARDRATDFDEAREVLAPFAQAAAAVALALDPNAKGPAARVADGIATGLVAQRLLGGDDGALPLQLRARLGADASDTALLAEAAATLLRKWPATPGLPRAERIQLALLAARLRGCVAGSDPSLPLPAWRALVTAWQAARRSVPPA